MWQVTAIRFAPNSKMPVHCWRENPWLSCQVHQKVSTTITFRRVCIPAWRVFCRLCGVARHGPAIRTVLRRVWWIPLKCFSSCCFCSFPAHFTYWQASLCFRWEGEWVWQDCGWALSMCVSIQLAGHGRMPAYPPPFLWMCTSRCD